MRKTPTAELDPYAYDMVMFYLQEHNIKISDVDSIEVTLCKNRDNKIYYRNINIIKKKILIRTPKAKSCRSCLYFDVKKAIDGDTLCTHQAIGHKTKGWGGRINGNDKNVKII